MHHRRADLSARLRPVGRSGSTLAFLGWGTHVRVRAPSEKTESRFASHRVTNTHSLGRDMPEHGRNVHLMQSTCREELMRFWGAVSLDTRPESSDIEPCLGRAGASQETGPRLLDSNLYCGTSRQ